VENIRRKLGVHSGAQVAAWVTGQRLRPGRGWVVGPMWATRGASGMAGGTGNCR